MASPPAGGNARPAPRCVALLRGINVGRARRIAMADLRRLMESLGHRNVRTLLNSGNVVFTPGTGAARNSAAAIEEAVRRRHSIPTPVTLLTAEELRQALRVNPLAEVADDPRRLLLMVFPDATSAATLKPLLARPWGPDRVAISGRVAYLWCAGGVLASPLWRDADRLAGERGTSRNLATMTRLLALVDAA